MRKKRTSDEFNIAFLDVICCGFGAIILLLMITKTVQPVILEQSTVNLNGQIKKLQQTLFELRGQTRIYNRELTAKREQLDINKQRIAVLKTRLATIDTQFAQQAKAASLSNQKKGELAIALQSLTDEMQRLLGQNYQAKNDLVGGIPVDSEYIIFIIDTSGSMYNYGWQRMLDEVVNILSIYPKVKGIQVMNDMGDYLFSNYRRQWIPDTEARRAAVIKRLRRWNPFSNSSPVEGITKAIRTFFDGKKKISLYVLGDEFTGRSIAQVLQTVARLNQHNQQNERLVRIHAVGFPVQFIRSKNMQKTGIRLATLMRELTYRNGGTFVGLNDYRP